MYSHLSKISSQVQISNFGYLSSGHYIYVSKDVMIRSYVSKPNGVREQKTVKHWYKQFLALNFSRVLHFLHHNEIQTCMTQTSEQYLLYLIVTTYTHNNNTYKNIVSLTVIELLTINAI